MTFIDNPSEHVVVMERREVMSDSTWLDPRQAGIYTSLSAATIRKACRQEGLRHVRVGRASGPILTRAEWVDAWIMRWVQGPAS